MQPGIGLVHPARIVIANPAILVDDDTYLGQMPFVSY